MENIIATLAFGFVIIVVVIYVLYGLFLNSFNKAVEGRGTVFAFIPIGNLYLLGALTFNSTMGIVLVLASFGTSLITYEPLYESLFSKWLPPEVATQISYYYTIFFVATLLMGIVKYIGLKLSPDKKKSTSFKDDNMEEQSKYENNKIITDSHNTIGNSQPEQSSNPQSNNDDLIFTNDDSPMEETPSVGTNSNVQENVESSSNENGESKSDLENFFN